MKKTILFLFLAANVSFAQYRYPATKTVDSSDTWHNITVKDPYRWLEDLKSEETQNWFKAQNDFTKALTDKLPLTTELYNGLLMMDSIQPDKTGKIRQVGNVLYYFGVKLDDAKMKLYRRVTESGKEELVADHTLWGSNYNLQDYEIDPYQKYIAVTAGEGGKEITAQTKFYDIIQNKFLTDSLPGRFAGYAPGKGHVYYMQQPTWDVHVMVQDKDRIYKVHKLGTDTIKDKVLLSYERNPELYDMDNTRKLWPMWLNKDCDYELVGLYSVSPFAELYYRKINSNAPWKKIISTTDEVGVMNAGYNKLFMVSKKAAPNGKILVMDMSDPDFSKAKTIVPERDVPLDAGGGLTQSRNFILLPYTKNGVQMHHDMIDMRTNQVSSIPFPENTNLMYVTPFNISNDDVHIVRTGWATPETYSYSNLDKPFAREKAFSFRPNPNYPYVNEMLVEEVEIPGHDGVMIPISIIRNKNLKFDGTNPAYVYGYGAYGYSTGAGFASQFLLLAHKGVVIVVAHVRGGGEKGENWHRAGYKQSKPNTWKDLNSTAEYLIKKGYTSAKHLACEGGSAGGILIGRAVTERPDLWACAVPQTGVLTVMRKEFTPNGPGNIPEYGTVKNINEFFALMEMDALLHVQDSTKYPAMLITTGWNDPRVISWIPAKFAAAAQKANISDKPVLLQVDYNAGHGDSEDKFAAFKKEAVKWAFILEHTRDKK